MGHLDHISIPIPAVWRDVARLAQTLWKVRKPAPLLESAIFGLLLLDVIRWMPQPFGFFDLREL